MSAADTRPVLWLDCGIGVAGDMLTGALVAAGADAEQVRAAVAAVARAAGAEQHLQIDFEPVIRAGLTATRSVVTADARDQPHRRLADIHHILATARLDRAVADDARAVFGLLADAEAIVHGCDVAQVHFHEVGALDAIGDIVAALTAWRSLGAPATWVSPVALGAGTVRMDHGLLPVPAPAVAQILRGAPTLPGPLAFEACTPTGAALAAYLAGGRWGPCPAMTVAAQGYGAGLADPPHAPNVTRAIVGHQSEAGAAAGLPAAEALQELHANIDDLDPRAWPSTIGALLAAGALDAWLTPIVMKHGRPAVTLSVLCHSADAAPLTSAIFELTPTLGVRRRPTERVALQRRWVTVTVLGAPVRVKFGILDGHVVTRQPEWRDIERVAREAGCAPRIVLQLAIAAALAHTHEPGEIGPETHE